MGSQAEMVKPANGGFDATAIGDTTPPLATTTAPADLFAATAAPVTLPVRRSVDPHSIVHKKKLSKPALAVLGAEILDGRVALLNPTRDLVAKAVGVSTAYIDAARRLSPEARLEVACGSRTLAKRG